MLHEPNESQIRFHLLGGSYNVVFDQLILGVRYGNDGDYVTHQNTKKANYGTRIASQYEGHKASASNNSVLLKENYQDFGSIFKVLKGTFQNHSKARARTH